MRILAIEPFYGGSHRSFLDGWRHHSRHDFTILGLPAYKWKWRMRHAPLTMAEQLREQSKHTDWDVVWCSDMLNLPEFIGLTPPSVRSLPRVAYFHENQLTYPVREASERDLHFAYSNFMTAVCADQLWFNSNYHRTDFLQALQKYLSRMPDFQHTEQTSHIRRKSTVQYPGIEPSEPRTRREPGPMRVCWNARWEHDKNPEDFFEACRRLKKQNFDFRLIVLGESFRSSPNVFQEARDEFAQEIMQWGFAESRKAYVRWLRESDVIVSSAIHEFFGIGVVEAVANGAIPVLPNRLAYPEVLRTINVAACKPYGESAEDLAEAIESLGPLIQSTASHEIALQLQQSAAEFSWSVRARQMDDAIERLVGT